MNILDSIQVKQIDVGYIERVASVTNPDDSVKSLEWCQWLEDSRQIFNLDVEIIRVTFTDRKITINGSIEMLIDELQMNDANTFAKLFECMSNIKMMLLHLYL